jgi:hypothetical protein
MSTETNPVSVDLAEARAEAALPGYRGSRIGDAVLRLATEVERAWGYYDAAVSEIALRGMERDDARVEVERLRAVLLHISQLEPYNAEVASSIAADAL